MYIVYIYILYDERLKNNLSSEEYKSVLESVNILVEKNRIDNARKHNKKLARDITSCHNYIAWQSYADIKTFQCKNSR